MLLLEKVMYAFDQNVRTRGKSYYQRGLVQIIKHNNKVISAKIRGLRLYDVFLGFPGREMMVSCTCPHYEDNYNCKHIWATLLMAADQGILPDMMRLENVVVSHGKLDDEEDTTEDDLEISNCYDGGENTLTYAQFLAGYAEGKFNLQHQPPTWADLINRVRTSPHTQTMRARKNIERERELSYIFDTGQTSSFDGLVVEIVQRERRKNGGWGREKQFKLRNDNPLSLNDPLDREITSILIGGKELYGYNLYGTNASTFSIPDVLQDTLMPMFCATKRCFIKNAEGKKFGPLSSGDGEPWKLALVVSKEEKHYLVKGMLQKGDEKRDLSEPTCLLTSGKIIWPNCIVDEFADNAILPWIDLFRDQQEIPVPLDQGESFVKSVFSCASAPNMILPDDLTYEEVRMPPRPFLRIRKDKKHRLRRDHYLNARLDFEYGNYTVASTDDDIGIFCQAPRQVILRDRQAEDVLWRKLLLHQIKGNRHAMNVEFPLEFHEKHLPAMVRTLVADSWRVEAEGKLFRQSATVDISVKSGIDWFELHGECDFGGIDVPLPKLLKALKRGESTVILGDGTFGVIPEDWLKKYGSLLAFGNIEKDHIRFSRCQVGVLDALLAAQPDDAAKCDTTFEHFRNELQSFKTIEPVDSQRGFKGKLRDYQKDGMGWLLFLNRFGFGGCLADDMGLGKTVQALSLLENRRQLRVKMKKTKEPLGPSLIVVPRSLLFNWNEEAAQFTPKIRVLINTGSKRLKNEKALLEYDIILTTYTTLRLDILHLKEICFDYIILDESQAIKNAKTATSKAVRLLQCRHRLALSGTPIENHLGELWSLFEFLNPGMLGTAKIFQGLTDGSNNVPEGGKNLLAQAIRPFILRRTKSQVAPELPKKMEETLYCELEGAERKAYNDIRDYYRTSILSRIDKDGVAKSKIHVLEALLRLRQAACHPGLMDKNKVGESSTKLDTLLAQVSEVVEEGHKALVFSQFTSMLGIVRTRLDAMGIRYAYLDGSTRNREEKVKEFQEDPECMLFLISLKAGGVGLNLTAAEYVYLLDPWWNPAVEAQAIDRTHRIGQERPVFAYRLISRNTVEEKVLELQKSKKELADAVINADSSIMRNLTREDLELLLA